MQGSWQKRNNTWSYRFRYKDAYGKSIMKRLSFPGLNKRQAEFELKNKLAEFNTNTMSGAITLEKLLELWLEQKKYLSPNTIAGYNSAIKNHLYKLLDAKITDLNPIILQQFFNNLDLSPRSKKSVYNVLHCALDYACNLQMIPSNPTAYLSLPKLARPDTKSLSIDEIKKLFIALETFPYKYQILVLFHTALRRAELCALRWSDIDYENKTLNINRALVLSNGKHILKTPKNGKTRQQAMSEGLIVIFRKLETQKENEWVFPNAKGDPLSPNTLYDAYQGLTRKIGISSKLHIIRHSVITILAQHDVSSKVISEIGGHGVVVSMERYTHLGVEDQRDAMELLASLIASGHK